MLPLLYKITNSIILLSRSFKDTFFAKEERLEGPRNPPSGSYTIFPLITIDQSLLIKMTAQGHQKFDYFGAVKYFVYILLS